MSELKLKSETKKISRKIAYVRTVNDVQFFGVNGSQISSYMNGMHLEYDGFTLNITNDNFPGEMRQLFPAGISFIAWKDDL